MQVLPHDEIISRIDNAGEKFQVLLRCGQTPGETLVHFSQAWIQR